jgi:hypothetical protein
MLAALPIGLVLGCLVPNDGSGLPPGHTPRRERDEAEPYDRPGAEHGEGLRGARRLVQQRVERGT